MKIADVREIIEKAAPLSLQENWDNSGWQLLLADKCREINCIMVAL